MNASAPYPRKALGLALAAALAVTGLPAAPARADGNADTIVAVSFFALVAAAVIAGSQKNNLPGPVLPQPDPRKTLPDSCRFEVMHGAEKDTFYGSQCLVARFDHWPYLPDRCETALDFPHRRLDLRAYDAACLDRYGYRGTDETYRIRH